MSFHEQKRCGEWESTKFKPSAETSIGKDSSLKLNSFFFQKKKNFSLVSNKY